MKASKGNIQLSASDLANHLACKHLTELDRLVATGKKSAPSWRDPALAILEKRGRAHEEAYVEFLRAAGLSVVNLIHQPREATLDAMRQGVEVIVQATLGDDTWIGRADILRRVPASSDLGNWSYEVEDTKLALDTWTGTVLQLCLYTDFLGALQKYTPTYMHVIKPGEGFPRESFLFTDFQAYYRFARSKLLKTMSTEEATPTYPNPVSHCDVCRWSRECDAQWHQDDHLCLIAGIRSLHIAELQRQGVQTLAQFAKQGSPLRERPERGNEETFTKVHAQARIQLRGREENRLVYELLAPSPGRGFSRLPLPSAGDIYFDIEGDPFFHEGGIEYLLGWVCSDAQVGLEYRCVWALDRPKERSAFEAFIDFVMDRWKTYPDMHVYHFSPYEPGAIKRLTGRHGTREAEVDKLLRAERFVDLLAVTREGLLASVEHYSLKDLERFASFSRNTELSLANAARRRVECALELEATVEVSDDDRRLVESYNRDDCVATSALHRWLEERRMELQKTGLQLTRPENKSGEASQNIEERQDEISKLFQQLVTDLPADRSSWDDGHKAKWLLAHLVDYFRREDRCAWWEFFRVHNLDYEDLLEERKAIAGLSFDGVAGTTGRSVIHRYRYPPQEVGVDEGDELHEVGGDKVGSVYALDQVNRNLEIKRSGTPSNSLASVHVNERVSPGALDTSLMQFARSVIEHGVDYTGPYRAARDLLLKQPPRLSGAKEALLPEPGEDVQSAAIRIARSLDNGLLAIQGPPGTGKTYTGGHMIMELAASGKRVGVTAVSHKVIRNLLESADRSAKRLGVEIRMTHKVGEKSEVASSTIEEVADNKKPFQALNEGKVVGGTAWLWARDEAVQQLDYLFVDEAGQMSLAQALAAARAAKNVILLGDPQQLEQPQQGAHPEGADVAALSHILDGHKTIPLRKGLFLDTTWRLHPAICAFTSEIFYEKRLHSHAGLEKQALHGNVPFRGSGLFCVPVNHRGNQNKSVEEVTAVARIVELLISSKTTWSNHKAEENQLHPQDVLIVAPYNAQVSALQEALPGMRIGTVDKFQGQEAPVVIYSMTSSSHEDAPRGMSFLYSPNRLNVGTSRARCACILVAAPRLFEPSCHTVDQMRWTNALCRFREMATEVGLS